MGRTPSKPKSPKKPGQVAARRAAPRLPTPPMPDELRARIAARAYELYLQRTSQGAVDDWLKAERDILRHPHADDPVIPHRGGYTGEEQE